MPSSVLAASKLTCGIAQVLELSIPDKLHGTENLKPMIRPYLREGAPKIEVLAEIMGVSPRSLQRKLKQSGSSYSELIETTRFEMAAAMLKDPDIAMMFGYENQANFGRGFRRVAGIGPGKYRREMFGRERAA